MSRIITLIVVHCSASRCNQRYTVEMLRKDHNARFHNQGVGYHYYIERDGQLYPTRREAQVGIHARGYNANSIGICYEGGLDENGKPADTRTPAQKAALIALLRSLRTQRCPQRLPLLLLPGVQRLLRPSLSPGQLTPSSDWK